MTQLLMLHPGCSSFWLAHVRTQKTPVVCTCIAAAGSCGWRHLFRGHREARGSMKRLPSPSPAALRATCSFISEHRPSDSVSDTGCVRCCQDAGLRDPSQVTWGTSSSSIRPGSISPPVWDAKSTEQSVSSVLPGSSGHGTASASPEGREKGGHKHSSSVTISSTALQQWCIEQPVEDNGFEILLPPPHPIEIFKGGKKGKKRKEKEALGPLETSAPSQGCSAQAKHLSLNGV